MMRRLASCLPVACLLLQAVLLPGVAARAATPFDGTYSGTFYSSGAGNCPPGGNITITVVDGSFNTRGSAPGEKVATKVQPDGTFSVENGNRNVRGSIKGNDMSATATSSGRCTYLWSLKK